MPTPVSVSSLQKLVDAGQLRPEEIAAKVQAGEIELHDDRGPATSAPANAVQHHNFAGIDYDFDPSTSGANDGFGAYAKQGLKSVAEAGIGAGKGAIGTLYHIGRFVGAVPKNADFEKSLEDENAAQVTGHLTEQVAEFAGGEGAANAVLKASGAATKIASAGRAVKVAANAAKGAAVGGVVTAAQGGSAGVGAAVGGGVPLVGAAIEPLANSLAESAAKSYSRVLGATKSTMKNLSGKAVRGYDVAGNKVQGLVERGVLAWTRKGLSAKAAAEVTNLGDQIDNLWSALPKDETTVAQPILDSIESAKSHLVKTGPPKTMTVAATSVLPTDTVISVSGGNVTVQRAGTAVIEPGAVRNLDRVKKLVETLTDDQGQVNVHDLRSVKQIFDETVAAKGGYAGQQMSIADAAGVNARKKAANAIREQLARQFPDIATINRQFNFWSNVQDIVVETLTRTSSQSQPMGQQIARVAGAAAAGHAGVAKAVLTGEAASVFRKLTTSAAWGTTSAVVKDRLASLLATGQTNRALLGMRQLLQASASKASAEQAPKAFPRRPGYQIEFPLTGDHDENDSLLMRRTDDQGKTLQFPMPTRPSDLLPEHFKNARNVRYGAPLSGQIDFDGTTDARGLYGERFEKSDKRQVSNNVLIARAAADEPGTYAHEVNHAIYQKDLTPEQRQQFQAKVTGALDSVIAAMKTGGRQAANALPIPKAVLAYADDYFGDPKNGADLAANEAFAELGAQYMLNPTAFRAKYPDWYGLYKEFYGGKEYISKLGSPRGSVDDGPLTPGNVDLHSRPTARNADGSISTVLSKSFNFGDGEVLLPTISDDGRRLSDQEAIDLYRKTGKHLGIFGSPEAATRYARELHSQQAREYGTDKHLKQHNP